MKEGGVMDISMLTIPTLPVLVTETERS